MVFYPTHRHADGGLYQCMGPQKGRMDNEASNGWHDGVAYRNEEGMMFWTDGLRWIDRFTEIEPAASKDVMVWDDQNDSVAAFRFSLVEASDVYYLITKAGPQRGSNIGQEFLDWMKRVLTVQAEMIQQNLHVRVHDFPDLIGDVAAFHAKFGQEYLGKPRMLPQDLHDFRTNFHHEETTEYRDEYDLLATAVLERDRREIIHRLDKQLDALLDSAWVILGTADLQYGRQATIEGWKRVVKANMSKVLATDDPDAEDSGREVKYDIRKPKGWLPPDHSDLVSDNAIFDEWDAPAPDVETNTFNQDAGSYSDTRAI